MVYIVQTSCPISQPSNLLDGSWIKSKISTIKETPLKEMEKHHIEYLLTNIK